MKRITGDSLLDWFIIALIPLSDFFSSIHLFTYFVVDIFCNIREKLKCFSTNLGSVYAGQDLLRTGGKLVRISLAFALDLVDPVWIGSAI